MRRIRIEADRLHPISPDIKQVDGVAKERDGQPKARKSELQIWAAPKSGVERYSMEDLDGLDIPCAGPEPSRLIC